VPGYDLRREHRRSVHVGRSAGQPVLFVPFIPFRTARRAAAAHRPAALLNIDESDGPTNTTKETPANPGGAMICGDAVGGKTTLHVCTWIDATEYGLTVFPKSVSYAQADRYSLALWKASEHS